MPLERLKDHDAWEERERIRWWDEATPEERADALKLRGRERIAFLEQCRNLSRPPKLLAAAESMWGLIVRSGCVLHEQDGRGRLQLRGSWSGSAEELEALLKGNSSRLSEREKQSVPKPNWIGQRLRDCARCFGESVCQPSKTRLKRIWTLQPDPNRPQDHDGTIDS
jgi:hypothetical protein